MKFLEPKFYNNPEVFGVSILTKLNQTLSKWVNVNASLPYGPVATPSLYVVFTDIENLLFSDARKVDDPPRLTPSLQSLGNPGTRYVEQREFPSFQKSGEANSYFGNIEILLQ
jgi:hypothetical protein